MGYPTLTLSTLHTSGLRSSEVINRRFPEITGEIIQKSEAPAVGHHFRHGLLAYIGPWFQNGGGSRKVLVCDSIRPSGMDLYYTGLLDARYALETLFFFFFYPRTTVFLAGPHAVCPFRMADWLNRLRAFIIYTVFLIKKMKSKKSSVASAASSVALHGLPEADHCKQRIEYRTRNSEASCSIPSLASDCG